MAVSRERTSRRTVARVVLAGLLLIHVFAVAAYALQNRQQLAVVRFLDARSSWREGRLDAAAQVYRELLESRDRIAFPLVLVRNFPSNADIAYLLGRVEADRHRVAAALAAYALSLESGGRGAREYRDLLLESGRNDDLLAYAARSRARDPASPQPWKDMGAALLALHRPNDAKAAYREALARLPGWRRRTDPAAPAGLSGAEADLWNLLAAASLQAGDTTGALAACETITSRQTPLAPLDRPCRALLADHAGHRALARHALEGYIPSGPEHEALLHDLLPQP